LVAECQLTRWHLALAYFLGKKKHLQFYFECACAWQRMSALRHEMLLGMNGRFAPEAAVRSAALFTHTQLSTI
jgi:hypothetical protein